MSAAFLDPQRQPQGFPVGQPMQYSAPAPARSGRVTRSGGGGGAGGLYGKQSSATSAKANGTMYMAISVAMIGAAMFGLDQGNFGNVAGFSDFRQYWCSGHYGDDFDCGLMGNTTRGPDNKNSTVALKENHKWHNEFVLWGATLITFGAAFGALIVGPRMSSKYGRRPCVSLGGGVCGIGCLMASWLAFDSVPVFMVGRFTTGFGVGISCFALPLYNGEMSVPSIRGQTGSLFQLNVVVGCFLSCIFTLFIKDWMLGVMLPGIAGFFLMIAVMFIPESPRYVMQKEGYDAGVEVLEKIRRGDVSIEAGEIMREIESERDNEELSYGELCGEPNVRRRVVIACVLVACQQFTGVNAFLGYASKIFSDVGIDDPVMFNTLFNTVMIVGCVAGLMLIDSPFGGRRSMLLYATSIMGPPLFVAGLALSFDWPGIVTMACVCIYGIGFQLAWGNVPWVYPAEIFSMAEKEKAISLAVFIGYMNNAFILIITPFIMEASTPGTMFFFSAVNVLNGLFVYKYIKETKGVPLEDVPAMFAKDKDENSSTDGDESD